MKLEDVLTKKERELIDAFTGNKPMFGVVKKALLLSFYFRQNDVKQLRESFNDLDIRNNDKQKTNKGNPAR